MADDTKPSLDAATLAELRRLFAEETAALAAYEAQPSPTPFGHLDREHDHAQAAFLDALWPHRAALLDAAEERDRLRAERRLLAERLEITHFWTAKGDGPIERVEASPEEQKEAIAGDYDGIGCRDETIRQQDKRIEALRATLLKIAFPEDFRLSDIAGNPARWSSTVAYLALGGRIEDGRRADRDRLRAEALALGEGSGEESGG